MKNQLLFFGICFTVATVVINLFILLKYNVPHVQQWYCWSIVSLCGTLIYNGGYYYLKKRKGVCVINVGVIILGVLVFIFLF
ncbi:hypothetical protein BJP49_28790 [Paenibacillus odorifer]|uniref:Uncharacterized protein n=1 Tax=Paenibacillus odorifer TaxID=189426 RepID=A0AB36J5S9_9BACL|nr:hypothetical protein BJP49_28790 [Paenibacillus odorifer]OMD10017.1 hypothetical protein BJP50_28905 [Paenibacillus odorifer]OME07070.1 hypothetical protein BSK60_31875 [Paenibacillus odorifer]OME09733.1 hypothetical protein BSK47_31875 [Paenibacillus odorifer]